MATTGQSDWGNGLQQNLPQLQQLCSEPAHVLADQYDESGDANEPDPRTGNPTTIIEYGGGFVLGWENENWPTNPGYDATKDPAN